jgi:predicted PurR-regulated permease PerM
MARQGRRRWQLGGTAGGDTGGARPGPVTIRIDRRSARHLVVLGLVFAALLLAGLWVFTAVSHFLFLLLLAWLLAVAMEPAIQWCIRHGRSRGVGTAITGVVGAIIALALTVLFGNAFVQQLIQLVQSAPELVTGVVDWVNSTFNLDLDPTKIASSLHLEPANIAQAAEGLAGGLLGVAGSLGSVLFDFITVLVFAFYFAGSGPKLLAALAVWLPPERQLVVGTVWEITAAKTGGYVVSKIELAALSAFFHGVFFWAIGLPSWLPMALLVGITAQFIPMVGTYIGIIIPVIVALLSDPWNALWIIAFATVYQQIETYLFTPKVSRRTMDVHPAIALAAVFLGAAVWGPIGAIIGIPIAAAGVAIAETFAKHYDLAEELRPTEAVAVDG